MLEWQWGKGTETNQVSIYRDRGNEWQTSIKSIYFVFPLTRMNKPYRLTVIASCPMKLQYFPMDRQKCTIEVESCKYSFLSFLADLHAISSTSHTNIPLPASIRDISKYRQNFKERLHNQRHQERVISIPSSKRRRNLTVNLIYYDFIPILILGFLSSLAHSTFLYSNDFSICLPFLVEKSRRTRMTS